MELNTKEFQEALKIVKPGLARTELINQSTDYAFRNGRIITYNDEISISHPVNSLDVTGVVEALTLYNYVTRLKRETMTIKTTSEEMQITCGKSKVGIPLMEEILLPLDQIDEVKEWFSITEDFVTILNMASGATAQDLNMGVFTCVYYNKDTKTITGSDNYRILHSDPLTVNGKVGSFLVPAKSAHLVPTIIPNKIAVTESWVHFKNERGTIMSCRTVPDQYKDLSGVIDNIEGQTFEFPRTMLEVIERANIFSKKANTWEEEVQFTIANNRITLRSQGDSGWFEESINHRYKDEPFSFSIIPYLLQDILKRTSICTVSDHGLLFVGQGWRYISSLLSMKM